MIEKNINFTTCLCRISRMSLGCSTYYCDTCGKCFDDRENPPCGVNMYSKENDEKSNY